MANCSPSALQPPKGKETEHYPPYRHLDLTFLPSYQLVYLPGAAITIAFPKQQQIADSRQPAQAKHHQVNSAINSQAQPAPPAS